MFRLSVLLFVLALPSLAHAQRIEDRGALEIAFDHGVAQLHEPDEETIWSGATAALDVRLHASSGFGAMARVGTTFGRILSLEIDLAPTYRAWLHRAGARGLELGGGIGVSAFYNAFAPRVGVASSLLGGGVITVQLDYREHGFFVGVGYTVRWLPIGSQGDLDAFTYTATLRVGGEVAL